MKGWGEGLGGRVGVKGWGIRGESGRNGGGMGVGSSLNLGLKLGMQDQRTPYNLVVVEAEVCER